MFIILENKFNCLIEKRLTLITNLDHLCFYIFEKKFKAVLIVIHMDTVAVGLVDGLIIRDSFRKVVFSEIFLVLLKNNHSGFLVSNFLFSCVNILSSFNANSLLIRFFRSRLISNSLTFAPIVRSNPLIRISMRCF